MLDTLSSSLVYDVQSGSPSNSELQNQRLFVHIATVLAWNYICYNQPKDHKVLVGGVGRSICLDGLV